MNHHSSMYVNINKLIKTMVVISIPVGLLAIVFWNVYPLAKVILFSFLSIVGIGILDRLLSWALESYRFRRREFFMFLLGVIIGVILVSNDILPTLKIVMGN